MIRGVLIVLSSLALTAGPALASQPAAAQDGFVPVSSLPPSEQLSAAPFLVGAYSFISVALLFYLWTIWRRIGRVEKEMRALERRSQGSGPR